MANSPKARQT